jgi:hypothetical protein
VAAMRQHDQAALTQHDVEVEVLGQTFVQLQREVVETCAFREQIIGTHNGGVASRVAAADPAALQECDVGEAVVLGKIIRGGEPMPAAAHDNGVITGTRRGICPRRRPVPVPRERAAQQRPRRVFQLATCFQSDVFPGGSHTSRRIASRHPHEPANTARVRRPASSRRFDSPGTHAGRNRWWPATLR